MLARISLLSLALCVIVFWLGSASAQNNAKPSSPTEQSQGEIDKLIDQLKSGKFKEREEATRRLMERDEALPALQKAAKSDDAEVAGRARKAIAAINKRLGKRALRRAAGLLKKGQTDLFVEQVVRWREYVDEDCWKAAVDHVEAIAEEASKVSGGQFKLTRKLPHGRLTLPWLDISKLAFRYDDHYRGPEGQGHGIFDERVIAEKVSLPDGFAHTSFLICRGPVKTKYTQGWSIIFANGNVRAGDKETGAFIGNSIVVCDGDVSATVGVSNSVILATGNVRVGVGIDNSVIICGGDVKWALKNPRGSAKKSVIQEHQRNPLDFLNLVHFFDPAQVGIEVKTMKKGVRVEALVAAKPFAQAGVRKGDQILAVDDVKVDSAEAFRRLLRQRIQESKPILLEIRREDKPLRIEVRDVGKTP